MSSIPSELNYTSDHEWVTSGDVVTVGITQHAVDALGDIVYVDLPDVGAEVTAGDACGEIESTKSVSDLFAPISGEVVEINEAAAEATETISEDPYGTGWLFRIRITGDAGELLDAAAYASLVTEDD